MTTELKWDRASTKLVILAAIVLYVLIGPGCTTVVPEAAADSGSSIKYEYSWHRCGGMWGNDCGNVVDILNNDEGWEIVTAMATRSNMVMILRKPRGKG